MHVHDVKQKLLLDICGSIHVRHRPKLYQLPTRTSPSEGTLIFLILFPALAPLGYVAMYFISEIMETTRKKKNILVNI